MNYLSKDYLVDWANKLFQPSIDLKVWNLNVKLYQTKIIDIKLYQKFKDLYYIDFIQEKNPYDKNLSFNLCCKEKNLSSYILIKDNILYIALSANHDSGTPNIYCYDNIDEGALNRLKIELTL